MSASLIGKKLGKYDVTGLLGQGGMAAVYIGHQYDIDRDVAIKVLAPHPGQDTRFVERFRLEARTIARLQHPHILPVYDYGDEDGVLYLVMAYVRGGSLADRLRKGPLAPADAGRLLSQIGGALDYAHRQNVVHRDVKPANILLDREGHALLTDFGIVKLMEGSSGLTGTGGMIGTPAYMSPEQAQSDDVDHRSDLYSLGVVAFEMLTGRQPFNAETPMQIVLKQISAPPPLQGLSMPFARVIGKALMKSPEDRYQTVADFVADFSRAVHGENVSASPGHETMSPFPDATVEAPTPYPPTGTGSYPPPTSGAHQMPTAAYSTGAGVGSPPTGTPPASSPPTGTPPTGSGQSATGSYPPTDAFATGTPPPTIITQQTTNPLVLLGGFAIIAVLIVVVVLIAINPSRTPESQPTAQAAVPTTAPTIAPSVPTFGRVNFSTSSALGDTIDVRLDDLAPAPDGKNYSAWLVNTVDDTSLLLGTARLDPLGAGTLSYTDSEGQTLPTLYNAIVIGVDGGDSAPPVETAAYSGKVPAETMTALQQILIASPDGIQHASLIQGALDEANIAVQHSGLAARADSLGSMQTHAEHTINILRGKLGQEDYNGNGRAENPGRGFGVPYFTDLISAQLTNVNDSPDANVQVQNQIELIRVCLVNIQDWMDIVIAREHDLLNATSVESVETQRTEATQYASAIVDGIDLNQNGQVEPFEGECGLNQIIEYGIAIGNYNIVAGGL